jgi:hypothetical protein
VCLAGLYPETLGWELQQGEICDHCKSFSNNNGCFSSTTVNFVIGAGRNSV